MSMWARVLFTIVVYSFMLSAPSDAQYLTYTSRKIIGTLKRMSRELVADTEVKIATISHYRDQYSKTVQYQLGEMAYNMRHKYKKMVTMFQLADRNFSYNNYDQNQNLPVMLEIQRMSLELETIAAMILEWQKKIGNEFHEYMNRVMRIGGDLSHKRDHEKLKKLIGRARPRGAAWAGGRGGGGGGRGGGGDGGGGKRRNKKWRRVTDDDFV